MDDSAQHDLNGYQQAATQSETSDLLGYATNVANELATEYAAACGNAPDVTAVANAEANDLISQYTAWQTATNGEATAYDSYANRAADDLKNADNNIASAADLETGQVAAQWFGLATTTVGAWLTEVTTLAPLQQSTDDNIDDQARNAEQALADKEKTADDSLAGIDQQQSDTDSNDILMMRIHCLVVAIVFLAASPVARAQTETVEKGKVASKVLGGYENDFIPGRPPSKEEMAAIEKEVAANPEDFKLVRKLGIGYFYRVFGAREVEAAPKAQQTLARALELKKDDALTIAFQAALAFVAGDRLPDLKGRHDELFKKARELEPDNVGVLSLAAAVYSGNTEKAIEITERIRKLLGPEFKNWSRHGQERVLFTQGRAYARVGRVEEARTCFEEGLRVNPTAFQAELDKLKK